MYRTRDMNWRIRKKLSHNQLHKFNFILTFLWNIFVNNHHKIMSVCDVLKNVSVQRFPREFCVCKIIKGTYVFRTLENEYYFNNYCTHEIIPSFNNSHMLHLKLELITKYNIYVDRGTIIWYYSLNFVRISVHFVYHYLLHLFMLLPFFMIRLSHNLNTSWFMFIYWFQFFCSHLLLWFL